MSKTNPKLNSKFNSPTIGMWLENYSNLFSDFDHRSYQERALSDDFLHEAQKILQDIAPHHAEFTLFIPKNKRRLADEKIIIHRLSSYFHHYSQHLCSESKKALRNGIIIASLGMLGMFGAAILASYNNNNLAFSFLNTILEPSSWFAAWFGFDQIFYGSQAKNKELKTYQRLAHIQIVFRNA